MQFNAHSVEEYISMVPDWQREPLIKLREAILENLPSGFSEDMSYGMIGYVVPFSLFPAGYHANASQPLPFISIGAQKNYLAVYHFGIYVLPDLLNWFTGEYPKYSKNKPDMGKGCIRFKNTGQIPYKLIGELAGKIEVAEWISQYELMQATKTKTMHPKPI